MSCVADYDSCRGIIGVESEREIRLGFQFELGTIPRHHRHLKDQIGGLCWLLLTNMVQFKERMECQHDRSGPWDGVSGKVCFSSFGLL